MKDTLKFFEIARPNINKRDFFVQYSVHVEEFAEGIEAIGSKDSSVYEELMVAIKELREDPPKTSDEMIDKFYDEMDRQAMLDSLCDQYVTLIGTARTLGFDIESAIKEVEASNLSKFIYVGDKELSPYENMTFNSQAIQIEDEGRYEGVYWKRVGEYIVFYDGNGKILKAPSTYFEPNLEKFV